jgi:hypothetical protein
MNVFEDVSYSFNAGHQFNIDVTVKTTCKIWVVRDNPTIKISREVLLTIYDIRSVLTPAI